MLRLIRSISMLLCLSVLLSGCISMNTAMFRPEPESGGDWTLRVLGGGGDVFIGGTIWGGLMVLGLYDWLTYEASPGLPVPLFYLSFFLINSGIIAADVGIRDSIPSRSEFKGKEPDAGSPSLRN